MSDYSSSKVGFDQLSEAEARLRARADALEEQLAAAKRANARLRVKARSAVKKTKPPKPPKPISYVVVFASSVDYEGYSQPDMAYPAKTLSSAKKLADLLTSAAAVPEGASRGDSPEWHVVGVYERPKRLGAKVNVRTRSASEGNSKRNRRS